MSRRRRAHDGDDESLELGLDTMCNALGGIIFIVLLLALLPTGPARSTTRAQAPSAEEVVRKQRLARQVEVAQRQLALQRALLDQSRPGPLRVDAGAIARQAEVLERIRVTERAIASSAQSDQGLRDAIRKAEERGEQLARLSADVDGMLEEASRAKPHEFKVTRLPRVRYLAKDNFFIVATGGRVLLPFAAGRDSSRVYPNETDFNVRPAENGYGFEPKGEAGVPCAQWVEHGAGELLAALPKEGYIIHVIVYPDSVDAFVAIRNRFTEAGYDYMWTPQQVGTGFSIVAARGPQGSL